MRAASSDLRAFLAANNVAHRADLFTLTTQAGAVYRWTTWERDLSVGGHTFLAARAGVAPIVKRSLYRQSLGTEIDTLDLSLNGNGFVVGGQTLPRLATSGFFDGARVQIDHLIMPTPGDTSLDPISSFFEGRVASASPNGVSVLLRLKSELVALNVLLPKFLIQPACGNVVYDANCGLSRAAYTLTGSASGTLTTTQVQTTTAGIVAKADNYFELGVLRFTSGALSGVGQMVQAFTKSGGTATFKLAIPFPVAPASGDSFTVYPGCDRIDSTCSVRFNNLSHFRGYPRVPKTEAGA